MTRSPLSRRLRKLERQSGDPDAPRFVMLFRPESDVDPFLDAIGNREMTNEEWLGWARESAGLPLGA